MTPEEEIRMIVNRVVEKVDSMQMQIDSQKDLIAAQRVVIELLRKKGASNAEG